MFVIPKKNDGVRPVFNLKRLNQYHNAPHFKMETIREVPLMIKSNDYLVSIDLSDAFIHVGLHPESRRFLRLKWRNQVYQYCTAAFGLASSPYVFTKVCRPILEHLHSRGFKISTYLDDGLLIANPKQHAETQARQVISLLDDLGLLINYKKSVLTPTKQLEHLGFLLNTRSMTALLPAPKLRDIRPFIKQVLEKPHRQSPRVIHSLTVRIQAATFAIFPARLYIRQRLYYKTHTVKAEVDWDQASLEKFQWWLGLRMKPSLGTWLLDSRGSNSVHQLERAKSGSNCSQDIPTPTELYSVDSYRQYDQSLLHQQTWRNSLSTTIESDDSSLGMVSPAPDCHSSTTHTRSSEQDLARTAPVGDSGGALLAQRSLVPSTSTVGSGSSLDITTSSGSNNMPQDSSPTSTAELDALRVASASN